MLRRGDLLRSSAGQQFSLQVFFISLKSINNTIVREI